MTRPLCRRKQLEARRAQYELPGFSAGIVRVQIGRALELLEHYQQGEAPEELLQNAAQVLERAQETVTEWMRLAACVTDYDRAREIVLDKED